MKAPYDSAKLLSDAAAKAYEDGSNNNAGTKKDWTTAKADSDGKKTTYDSRAKTAAAEKLAMENAKTAWENQVKEEAAQDAVQKLAVADVATQTAAVAKIATAQTTASTGTNAVATAASATQSAKQQAYDSAKAAYDAQVKVTAASGAKAKTPLDALVALRKTATDAAKTLADAIAKAKGQQALIDAKQKEVDTATATHLAAIVKCKENQYDAYRKTLATAEAKRKTDLAAIEKLVDAAKDAKPKAGATGARCEKAMSNGTFRPKRGEKVCTAATDCCGAAKGAMGGATMTIETCQPKTTTKYKYQPPRAPMATAWPAKVEWPFVCIDGASKLAAAASALAAAYMLA